MHDPDPVPTARPRIGSLFSGYGGLDLAVEHATGGETIWFSELNEHVARIYSHHWPDAPNLGDISTINWRDVLPVDILCGGFPCQDVSTVGKGAGLAPGTRSGLWSFMVTAIERLQPELVVIENVRGLLSARAARVAPEGASDGRNPDDATPATATSRDVESSPWLLGDRSARPLRALGAVLGDLADLRYDAQWIGLPASLAGAPHHRFRIFITAHRQDALPNPPGVGLFARWREPGHRESTEGNDRTVASDHRLHTSRAAWLSSQQARIGDTVLPGRDHVQRWGRYARPIARWEHITGREAPAPALLTGNARPRPAPEFVEWLMGLETGWVTDPDRGLTPNQQLTALGNGVLPLQAATALATMPLPARPR